MHFYLNLLQLSKIWIQLSKMLPELAVWRYIYIETNKSCSFSAIRYGRKTEAHTPFEPDC